MDKIRAPYNFVPAASVRLHEQDDAGDGHQDLQDQPFEDGICGTLTYELEAAGPLFVRGATSADRFFQLPGETFAIPGTTVRGMLRNVVEIASASKMARVNDHAYSVRDLTPAARSIYGDYMAEIRRLPNGKQEPTALVSAGWLKPSPGGALRNDGSRLKADDVEEEDDIVAVIEVCDFAKVEYRFLKTLANKRNVQFEPGRRQRSLDKYASFFGGEERDAYSWQSRAPLLQVGFTREVRRSRHHFSNKEVKFWSEIGKVTQLGEVGSGSETGFLVFTGQPNDYREDERGGRRSGNAKHHDFVFYRGPATVSIELPVTRRTFRSFQQVHSDRGQQNRLEDSPNTEWKHWKGIFNAGKNTGGPGEAREASPAFAVPVFFLPHEKRPNEVRALGLAMMFRLAYDHTIHDAVRNVQGEAFGVGLDMATALFGTVQDKTALRGRVSFDLLRAVVAPKELPRVVTVLGAPRASYFPNYFDHAPLGGSPSSRLAEGREYRTLMDPGVRIRGWKRYRVRAGEVAAASQPARSLGKFASSEEHNDDTATAFTPLAEGSRFRGHIRVHNVRPLELGALVWALAFGGAEDAFHLIGMAKPLGYGRVRLRVVEEDLERNDGAQVDLNCCSAAFVDEMDRHFGGAGAFAKSETIQQLLACAKPGPSADLRHMLLRHPDHRNEFVEAKKAHLTLEPAAAPGPIAGFTSASPAPAMAPTVSINPRRNRAGESASSGGFSRAAQVRPAPISPPKGPPVGNRVQAEVLEERTKKGGLVFRVHPTGVRGVLHPTSSPVPDASSTPGTRIELIVVTGGENPQLKMP